MKLADILDWTSELAGCDTWPADSQVYLEADRDVSRVLFGVDIGVADLLFAKQAGYDAVIAHHPLGDKARTDFARVVHRQVEMMVNEGVAREVAEKAVAARLDRMHRIDHMSNVNSVVDTGRLVGVPFCNVHLACDILGRNAIINLLQQRSGHTATVGDALGWLDEFPEIAVGHTRPEAWVGNADQPLGRWVVAMAGGTNGGYPVFSEYWNAGVDTIFAMHCAEDDVQRLRASALPGKSLVVTGHMSTDSIGINEVIRGLTQRGITVTPTSGIVTPD